MPSTRVLRPGGPLDREPAGQVVIGLGQGAQVLPCRGGSSARPPVSCPLNGSQRGKSIVTRAGQNPSV
jgi:hypothetical protein